MLSWIHSQIYKDNEELLLKEKKVIITNDMLAETIKNLKDASGVQKVDKQYRNKILNMTLEC